MHGGFGDPERLARFEAGEPAEVAQLDDPRLTRIEHLESFHGGVERQDRYRVRVRRGDGAGEGDVLPVAAAFERMFAARVLDQDPAHHARRDAEEMRAILPVHIRVDQPQIGFMDQRRGLERMSLGLAPELSPRQPAQLRIDERNQPVVRRSSPSRHSRSSSVTRAVSSIPRSSFSATTRKSLRQPRRKRCRSRD